MDALFAGANLPGNIACSEDGLDSVTHTMWLTFEIHHCYFSNQLFSLIKGS
jgi:hypothetical protein